MSGTARLQAGYDRRSGYWRNRGTQRSRFGCRFAPRRIGVEQGVRQRRGSSEAPAEAPEAPIAPEAIRTPAGFSGAGREAHPIAAPPKKRKNLRRHQLTGLGQSPELRTYPPSLQGPRSPLWRKPFQEKLADRNFAAAAAPPVPDVKTITTTGNTIPTRTSVHKSYNQMPVKRRSELRFLIKANKYCSNRWRSGSPSM